MSWKAKGNELSERELGITTGDNAFHMGDDTGRLIIEAWEADGANAAADVIEGFWEGLNEVRRKKGNGPISAQDVAKNIGFIFAGDTPTEEEQQEILDEFWRRHPPN